MNVNKTINNPAQLKADYRRIIETNLNLDRPRAPRLKTYYEIAHALETKEKQKFELTPTLNWKPTADYCAQVHKNRSDSLASHVREFIKYQERLDDKRDQYKKNKYTRSDYLSGFYQHSKTTGRLTAKVINDANNPPADVEQDRKMMDYTLRACQYLERIERLGHKEMIARLEPNLDYINDQFENGEWSYIHWYELGLNTDMVHKLNFLFNLHRVHVSLKSPLQIAHYPTLRHLRDRREVITKLGKYLTTFKDFIGITDSDIKNYVEKYNSIIAGRTGWEVKFIESDDPDGFQRIYRDSKAGSCMKGMDAVRVYAHDKSVIRLAYLVNQSNEIIARCITREDNKQYVRVYPDANGATEGRYLLDYLKANGYTHGNLEGCLLQLIEHEDECEIYEAPYIDAGINANGSAGSAQNGDIVEIDGKEYIQINTDGELCLTMTNGYTDDVSDEDHTDCDDCGDDVHRDDTYYTYCERLVCQSCIDNNYTFAWIRPSEQDYVHNDQVIWASDRAYYEDCDFSAFDVYNCEDSGDLYHIDDLVNTSRGFIYYDYATALDHEDADGNNYAHQDDVRTLSDGKTCHEDIFEQLQKELDEANKEDADQAELITQQQDGADEGTPSQPNDTSGYIFGDDLTPEQKQHNHNLLDQAEKDALKNETN